MTKRFSLRFVASILLLISYVASYAQFGGGGGNAGGPGGMGGGSNKSASGAGMQGARPAIGHIYGKIVDGKTKKGVEFASVALYGLRNDSLMGGQLTETNGDFSLDNLPPGGYKLKITYLGYKTIEQKAIVTMANADQDVGNIALEMDEQTLKSVTITGEKSTLELKPDRKVFNVEKDLSARGGTGVDVMKNIPGVSTDADGNVTLRNDSPLIYVDGKPTTLTLDQIPADQIDRVEVITNPSAKFEAGSTGGIINVVLKKNQKPGYNGIVTMAIGTNDQYNGMALINVREKKYGFMLSYNVNGSTNRVSGHTDRTNLNSNDDIANSFSHLQDDITSKRLFQVGRIGFDYYINNRNTLSITQSGTWGRFNTGDDETYNTIDSLRQMVTNGTRLSNQTASFQNYTTDISWRHTYPKPDKEWTLDLNYNHSQGHTGYVYNYFTYTPNGSLVPYDLLGNPAYEINNGGSHTNMITAQWDFTDPIAKDMKLEFGVRLNYQRQNSYQSVIDSANNESQINTALTTNYSTDNLINAAYITFSHQVKKFSYQIGLRVEETYFKGTILNHGDSSFSYQYPSSAKNFYEILFPSINLSEKFNDKNELQFNVTRKIRRPNFFQLNPFIFSSDRLSYNQGNPALQPEFDNKAELNYNLTVKGFNWLSSLYGNYNQQPITQYTHAIPGDSLDRLIYTFSNGKSSFSYGWENTIKVTPVKGLDITADGNVFYTDLTTQDSSIIVHNTGVSWNIKGIISYKFPLGITAQANGTYEAPRVIAQGHTLPMYFFDLSASKDFGIVSLNLSVSDVLNSRSHGSFIEGPDFTQTQVRRRDQRYARLGMTIKFGKMDSSLFGKKKKKNGDQQGGGEEDY